MTCMTIWGPNSRFFILQGVEETCARSKTGWAWRCRELEEGWLGLNVGALIIRISFLA